METGELIREPVTARLAEYPKLLASALEQAVGRFAVMDFRKGIEQGRFHMSMGERLLDKILVWSLVGLLIQSVEETINTEEVLSAYIVMALTNLGVPSEEVRHLSQQASRDLAER